jgi:NADPH:quinone reductase-like Zn-dependent oxidoreductase
MQLLLSNYACICVCSEVVLVTAAAGALGLAAVDLAANVFGAKVNSASEVI